MIKIGTLLQRLIKLSFKEVEEGVSRTLLLGGVCDDWRVTANDTVHYNLLFETSIPQRVSTINYCFFPAGYTSFRNFMTSLLKVWFESPAIMCPASETSTVRTCGTSPKNSSINF